MESFQVNAKLRRIETADDQVYVNVDDVSAAITKAARQHMRLGLREAAMALFSASASFTPVSKKQIRN